MCSKRQWDGLIKQWRRLLHQWDDKGASADEEDELLTADMADLADMDLDTLLAMDEDMLLAEDNEAQEDSSKVEEKAVHQPDIYSESYDLDQLLK